MATEIKVTQIVGWITLTPHSPDTWDVRLILSDIQGRGREADSGRWWCGRDKILMDDVHVKISISPFFASFLP